VGSADEVHVVLLQEFAHNVWAEGEGNTTVVLAPSGDILVGVRPEQVAKETWKREKKKRRKKKKKKRRKGIETSISQKCGPAQSEQGF